MIEKKISRFMGIAMGITMSFTMSLVGSLIGVIGSRAQMPPQAPKPPFLVQWAPSFLLSFLIATIIAIAIGMLVPMKKINDSVENKMGKNFGTHVVQSLISDLIYTPLISLCMSFLTTAVFVIPSMVKAGNPQIPPLPILALGSFGRSVIIEFLIALVVIVIIEPVFQKMAFKKYIPNFGQGVAGDDQI